MIRAGIHPIETWDSRLLCHKSLLRGENGRVVPKIGFRKQKMQKSARIPKVVSCHFWLLSGKNGRDVPKIGFRKQKMPQSARIPKVASCHFWLLKGRKCQKSGLRYKKCHKPHVSPRKWLSETGINSKQKTTKNGDGQIHDLEINNWF